MSEQTSTATVSSDLLPPPTVPGFPFFGNLLDFYRMPREFLIDAAARHGDVFRIATPIGPVNFITGAPARALAADPAGQGLHRQGFFRVFEVETDVDVFGADGDEHHRLRSLLKLGYARQISAQQAGDVAGAVADVTADWRQGDVVDLFEAAQRAALWSAMAVATPIDLRPWAKDFTRAGDTVMSVMVRMRPPQATLAPWYRLSKTRMWKVLGDVVARHRAGEFAGLASMSMTDAFIQSTDKDGGTMNDTAVRGAVAYGIVGTEIYVGRVIGFLLYELLRNPHLAAQVRAEVDAAYADGVFDASRLRRMPTLRGAYLETLRYYPLLPGLAFYAARDLAVGGHRIGKDELLFLSPQLPHFSPANYKNPNTFDATHCMAPDNGHLKPGAHAVYGVGKRTCLAPGMVEVIALTATCALMRAFDLELQRPTQTLDLTMKPLIAPRSKVGVVVRGRRSAVVNADLSKLSEAADIVSAIEEERERRLPDIEPEEHPAGTVLIEQGAVADAFFILLDGVVEVWRGDDGAEPALVAVLESGASFGEVGLLKGVRRTATVKARTTLRVLRVSREAFLQLVSENDVTSEDIGALFKRRYIRQGLAAALPKIDATRIQSLIGDLKLVSFKPGDVIIEQGSRADAFFIIANGQVDVWLEGDPRQWLAELGPGQYMGEMGILHGQPRSATCQAKTSVDAIRVDRERFVSMLGEGGVMEDVALVVARRVLSRTQKAPL